MFRCHITGTDFIYFNDGSLQVWEGDEQFYKYNVVRWSVQSGHVCFFCDVYGGNAWHPQTEEVQEAYGRYIGKLTVGMKTAKLRWWVKWSDKLLELSWHLKRKRLERERKRLIEKLGGGSGVLDTTAVSKSIDLKKVSESDCVAAN